MRHVPYGEGDRIPPRRHHRHAHDRRAAGIAAGIAASLAVAVAACARGSSAARVRTAPAPAAAPTPAVIARAPLPASNPALPPVPSVSGPLRITVVYPERDQLIATRDSNFIFGSVGTGAAGLRVNGALVPVWPDGAFMGWLPVPPARAPYYDLTAYTASDTIRVRHPVRVLPPIVAGVPEPPPPAISAVAPALAVTLSDDSLSRAVSDTDDRIIARPSPRGTYHWFLLPGTRALLTGYLGDMARVELDPAQSVWVRRRDVHAAGREEPVERVGAMSLRSAPGWVDLTLPAHVPPAYLVREVPGGLTLTLYNVRADTVLALPNADTLVRSVQAEPGPDRVVYHVTLTRPMFGYLVLYEHGTLTLRVRRPPVVDPRSPLRGQTIVVDPGHPPVGATGPTGLWEPVATLAVGLRVRALLAARGATVVMTRTSPDPVPLGDRPIIARRANADALVSIHLNADADGQDPFRDNGTGTYYFHAHSGPLAQDVQDALVPRLGLPNRGVIWKNLALCRPTWFPSVLTEGLFIIMPDQEAAIRTPQYQDAYARGIVAGLTRYFASLAH